MKIRLYMDEDSMSETLMRALIARGVDVVTAREEGMIARTDADHLDYATARGRVLYTFNIGDFHSLHASYLATGKTHAGIIFARQQAYSVGEQLRRLLKLMAAKSAEDMRDRIEFLGTWK